MTPASKSSTGHTSWPRTTRTGTSSRCVAVPLSTGTTRRETAQLLVTTGSPSQKAPRDLEADHTADDQTLILTSRVLKGCNAYREFHAAPRIVRLCRAGSGPLRSWQPTLSPPKFIAGSGTYAVWVKVPEQREPEALNLAATIDPSIRKQ